MTAPHVNPLPYHNRREFLTRCGMGLPMMGLASLVARPASADSRDGSANAVAPRPPHFAPRAKHVIHLFMNGGPSHLDTFDPKPALAKYAGKPLPHGHLPTERNTGGALASPFRFSKYGQSGIEVSELFPHVGRVIDDICVIRSMHANLPLHESSLMLMNCGDQRLARPSMGAWLSYGLGTENENLPGFVAMCPGGYPIKGADNWRAAFLPGVYQGTYVDTQKTDVEQLIRNIKPRGMELPEQRRMLDLVHELNRRHADARPGQNDLEARIQSFELAYRMQMEATDAFDIEREPQHIRTMYGDTVQARQILIARRLVERGVRFVQIWHGKGQPWDSHNDIAKNHRRLAGDCSQAIGALLTDLKQRGLLDETLVLWGGEFGRTPTVELSMNKTGEATAGRDHNHYGFTVWLAGGGIKGGYVHGATDEFGFQAVEDRVHVHDLHATMLYLLGFDHERLTYRHAGRDFRLTDVHGRVVPELLA